MTPPPYPPKLLAAWPYTLSLHSLFYTRTNLNYLNRPGELVDAGVIESDDAWDQRDSDHVGWLCRQTVACGHGVLVFCATIRGTEVCAANLTALLDVPDRGKAREAREAAAAGAAATGEAPPTGGSAAGAAAVLTRDLVVDELRRLAGSNETVQELARCVARGVGFHHSGLGLEEKRLVEDAFKVRLGNKRGLEL